MLIQMVSIKVKPDHLEEFEAAFRVNYEGTLREPGNVRFDVLCNPEDPTSFSIYEVFLDSAALDAHRQTDHYKECVRRIQPIIEGTRSRVYYKPVMAVFLNTEPEARGRANYL